MTTLKIVWNRRQKISCLWFLALLVSFGYPQPSRAGSASDTFSNSLDSLSEDSPKLLPALEDYFRDWFKRVDETQAVQPHWKPRLSSRPRRSSPSYTNTINIGSIFLMALEI